MGCLLLEKIAIKLFWENILTKSKEEERNSPEKTTVVEASPNDKNRDPQKRVREEKSN